MRDSSAAHHQAEALTPAEMVKLVLRVKGWTQAELARATEGRWPEIRELADRMAEIFRERRIHRETIAAVLLFQEAAEKEAVSVELVRRLQRYLQRAQARPGLRFE